MSTHQIAAPRATPAQLRFLATLAEEAGVDLPNADEFSRSAASAVIDALMAQNRKDRGMQARAARPEPQVTEGSLHRVGGVIHRVFKSAAGRLYAKKLIQQGVRWSYEYAAGAIMRMGADTLLTLEEAQEFGHQTGTCCVCGRLLTDPKSVEAGIGPVCASRF